jgi:hypothetical protein
MAIALAELGGVGCIHRFMSVEDQASEMMRTTVSVVDYIQSTWNYTVPLMAAVGANGDYLERAYELVRSGANIILIDVAHGHHKLVKDAITALKNKLPSYVDVIAGNIATHRAACDLTSWGADALRVGIGGGCFTPEMEVGTTGGLVPIKDVEIGDVVYTHTGEPKKVIYKFEYDRDEEIMVINGIECTKNHEFYVVHKQYENIVTEDNIHNYAIWVSAENLTDDHLLIEL